MKLLTIIAALFTCIVCKAQKTVLDIQHWFTEDRCSYCNGPCTSFVGKPYLYRPTILKFPETGVLPPESTETLPSYDTTKGVIVYYDERLNVKADSAYLIRRADKLRAVYHNSPSVSIGNELSTAHTVYIAPTYEPDFQEWKIVTLKGASIPLKNKILFNQ